MPHSFDLEFHEAANIFPMMGADEFTALRDDIAENGQRESIWTHQGKIIDGRNRYLACRDLGADPKLRAWDGEGSLTAFVVSLNLHRRHLSESQRAMVGAKIKPMFEDEARERQGSRTDLQANLPEGSRGQARDQAAQAVNVSPRSVESASRVLRDGAPELVEAVERGDAAVSTAADLATLPEEEQAEIVARGPREILAAAKAIRQEKTEEKRRERMERITEIARNNPNPQAGFPHRFSVVLADPPWRYDEGSADPTREIENHYPTMSLAEICALPVQDWVTDDAMLFLWTTAPKLAEAIDVIHAWGFELRSGMVWVKDRMGMGHYARIRHEHLLICRRGNFPTPAPADRFDSIIQAPVGEHSAKPEIVHEMLERMYPGVPMLEMFARAPRDGWTVWGNQAEAVA